MFSTNTFFFINEMNSVAVVDGTTFEGYVVLWHFIFLPHLGAHKFSDAVCGSHTTTQCVRLCFRWSSLWSIRFCICSSDNGELESMFHLFL